MLGGPEPPLVAWIVDSLMRAVINDRIAGNGGKIGNALVASLQQAIKNTARIKIKGAAYDG